MVDKRPTPAELQVQLHSLVNWETFGLHLPGIESSDIEKIQRDKFHVDQQKLSLFNKWLSVCPKASWSHVIIALEKAKEKSLANEVTEFCEHDLKKGNMLQEMETTSQDKMVERRHDVLQGDLTTHEFKFPSDSDEEDILTELKELHVSYTELLFEIRKQIDDLVKTKSLTLEDLNLKIKYTQFFQGTIKCSSIEDVFDLLNDHNNFLDCSILNMVIRLVLGKSEILTKAENHMKEVHEFKRKQPIIVLKNRLEEYCSNTGQYHIPVTIKLNTVWEKLYIVLVEQLVKFLLSYKSDMKWFSVKASSIQLTVLVPKESRKALITNCLMNLQFIQLVGVYSVIIDQDTVLQSSEDKLYTFEAGLLEACRIGNEKAVQFQLDLGVDVNHTNKEGDTGLMISSENGHMHIIEILLVAGTNVDIQNNNGTTALMEAKTKEVFLRLLEANADITIITYKGSTPFHVSCFNGNYEVTETLISKFKQNPNISRPDGLTPLHAASRNGHHDTVQLLLTAGASPNIQDNNGCTALELASLKGHCNVTQLLLDNHADPNLATNDGWTPLMSASQEGHHNIVELMLQKGVDPNVTNNKNGRTALIQASQNGHHDTVQLLLTAGASPNIQDDNGQTALELASLIGYYNVTQLLLDNHADTNLARNDGWTPLHVASHKGHYKIVELLLQKGVDPNVKNSKNGRTALIQASQNGHHDTVQLLLTAGASPNIHDDDGHTALELASFIGYYNVTQLLLDNYADPNLARNDGWTPLHVASHKGHYKIVELLLQKGVDPNVTNSKNGRTALIQASQNGHHDAVQLLLTAGASPNIQDNNGDTALELASLNGHHNVTQLLLDNRADPNLATNDGWTPLHVASQEGHYKIVELMLQNEVDPNVKNSKNGTTALIQASRNGHHDTVQLLLTEGASPNIQDNQGCTALELASHNGHYNVTQLLLDNHADPFIEARYNDNWFSQTFTEARYQGDKLKEGATSLKQKELLNEQNNTRTVYLSIVNIS